MPGQRVANGDDGGRGGDRETLEGFGTVVFPMGRAAGRLSRTTTALSSGESGPQARLSRTTTELSSGESGPHASRMLARTKSGSSLTSNVPPPYIARTNSRGSYSGESSPYLVRKLSEDEKKGDLLKVCNNHDDAFILHPITFSLFPRSCTFDSL